MIKLILLTDFTEAFAHNLLRGILNYSKDHEPWVVCRMPPSYKQIYGIPGVLQWAKKWNANAIIGQFNNEDDVNIFAKNGIVVLAQDFKSRFTTIPNITSCYIKTGEMVADFFLKKGFRNFAYFGYKDVVWSDERCVGFRNRIREKGHNCRLFEYHKQSLDNLWYYESKPLAEWIRSLPRSTALMACDDTQGNKIIEICRVLEINIPEEIAVIGVDNDETICSLSYPPLSSVSLNIEKGGYEAAQLIEKLVMNKDAKYKDVVIEPVAIINRLSSDIYSTDNPAILAAFKYIHKNIAHHIKVDDIVKETFLSRRLLEIRFRELTGQSIHQYISDLRTERFCQLLIDSKEPISDLAMQVGLPEPKNLARQFKILKGCTPSEYRKLYRKNNGKKV